jgi:hypothetical protein
MNEIQHDAVIRRDRCEQELRLRRAELISAVARLNDAEKALQRAVEADRPSWYGTPGLTHA